MSSFERFQRNVRSTYHSDDRSNKRRGHMMNQDRNIQDLVSFSENSIKFMCRGNEVVTQHIIMRNETGERIYFKVRSNNPKNYAVTPYEEVISHRKQITIKFEFMPEPLSSYRKDKFEIIWGKLPNVPGQPISFIASQKFPVEIFQTSKDQSVHSLRSSQQFTESYVSEMNEQNHISKNQTLLTRPIIIGVAAISFILGFILG